MSAPKTIKFTFKDVGSTSVEFTLKEFLEMMSKKEDLTDGKYHKFVELFNKIHRRKNREYVMKQTEGEDVILWPTNSQAQNYLDDIAEAAKDLSK